MVTCSKESPTPAGPVIVYGGDDNIFRVHEERQLVHPKQLVKLTTSADIMFPQRDFAGCWGSVGCKDPSNIRLASGHPSA